MNAANLLKTALRKEVRDQARHLGRAGLAALKSIPKHYREAKEEKYATR